MTRFRRLCQGQSAPRRAPRNLCPSESGRSIRNLWTPERHVAQKYVICSWVKEEARWGGALAVGCFCYFQGTVVSPRTAIAFLSEQSELHLSRRKLEKIECPQGNHCSTLDHPQHLHPTTSHSIQGAPGLPLQQTDGANCQRVLSQKATEQVVGYHSCSIANTKNSSKTLFSSVYRAGWRNMSLPNEDP